MKHNLKKVEVTEKLVGRYMWDSFQIDVYESPTTYEAWLSNPALGYPFRLSMSKALKAYTTYDEFLNCSCDGFQYVVEEYMKYIDAVEAPRFESGNTCFVSIDAEDFPELISKSQQHRIFLPRLHFMAVYKDLILGEEAGEDDTHMLSVYTAFFNTEWNLFFQKPVCIDEAAKTDIQEFTLQTIRTYFAESPDAVPCMIELYCMQNGMDYYDYDDIFDEWLKDNHLEKEILAQMEVVDMQLKTKHTNGKVETYIHYELKDGIKGFYTGTPVATDTEMNNLVHTIRSNYTIYSGLRQIFFGKAPKEKEFEQFASTVFSHLDCLAQL